MDDAAGLVDASSANRRRPAFVSEDQRRTLQSHYETAFGVGPRMVLHEQRSYGVHVDTCLYEPTERRPYITLATIGMSARPMNVPEHLQELQEFTHGECVIYLASDWDFDGALGGVPDEILRAVARIPHVTDSWVYNGHTIELPGEQAVPGSLLTDILVRWAPEQGLGKVDLAVT